MRVGEWDINRTIEPIPHQEVDVEDIIIHRDYYPGALYFDIAFLYLKSSIEMAENAAPICISPQNYKHRPNRCFVTGWGKDRYGREGRYHIIMKKVDVPIVSRVVRMDNYIHNLVSVISTCSIHLYTDNTQLYYFDSSKIKA